MNILTWISKIQNIARIVNAVRQCHSSLSGHNDCHEFRLSIVRIHQCLKVTRIVFEIVVAIVVVFVFAIVFLLLRSCLLIVMNKCLKGHKPRRSLLIKICYSNVFTILIVIWSNQRSLASLCYVFKSQSLIP